MKTLQANKPAKARQVSIDVKAEGAQSVAVTGDFNHWAKEGTPLRKAGDGTWRASLELSPGEYQYRLIVDGQWRDHPEAQKRVPNPFGTENCVLTVP